MDCQRVREAMFLFLDREMEEADSGHFRDHMNGCPPCAQRLGFTRKFLILVRERTVRLPAPPRLRQRILISLPHRSDGAGPGTHPRVEGA